MASSGRKWLFFQSNIFLTLPGLFVIKKIITRAVKIYVYYIANYDYCQNNIFLIFFLLFLLL